LLLLCLLLSCLFLSHLLPLQLRMVVSLVAMASRLQLQLLLL
jgi:hypothetical protein